MSARVSVYVCLRVRIFMCTSCIHKSNLTSKQVTDFSVNDSVFIICIIYIRSLGNRFNSVNYCYNKIHTHNDNAFNTTKALSSDFNIVRTVVITVKVGFL